MRQASGKASGPTVGSAGASRARRIGAAAVATLWLALAVMASQGLAATGMSREEAAAVIARTRQWVQGYMESLPNFTCRKSFRVFVGPAIRKPKLRKWAKAMPKWMIGDSGKHLRGVNLSREARSRAASRMMGSERRIGTIHESEWLVRMVQGEGESYEWIRGGRDGYGQGYFAGWLVELFREELQTRFEWLVDSKLRGHGVHVFSTLTPENFYRYDGGADEEAVFVGFRGKLYIEGATGRVLRYVAEEPVGLGKAHAVQSGRMLFDYDYVEIGGERVLLPVKSLVYTRYRTFSTVAESVYHRYQQFTSETKLNFGEE